MVDVGSDHGLLPVWLGRRGHRVIAVEKNRGPYERCAALGLDVRLGDGLDVVPEPFDCLVMSGFGALAMRGVLSRQPGRVPRRVVAQPNHSPGVLEEVGFELVEWVGRFPILVRLGSGPPQAGAASSG